MRPNFHAAGRCKNHYNVRCNFPKAIIRTTRINARCDVVRCTLYTTMTGGGRCHEEAVALATVVGVGEVAAGGSEHEGGETSGGRGRDEDET